MGNRVGGTCYSCPSFSTEVGFDVSPPHALVFRRFLETVAITGFPVQEAAGSYESEIRMQNCSRRRKNTRGRAETES